MAAAAIPTHQDPGFDYYYQWPCNHQYDYYDYCPYQIFPDCCADDCAVQCYPNYPIDPIEPEVPECPYNIPGWYEIHGRHIYLGIRKTI